MSSDQTENESSDCTPTPNSGYALFQIAKAFATVDNHPDLAVRQRANERINAWVEV